MSQLQLPEMPDSLKSLKPYLKLANLHDDRDLVVAYWCRLEAIQQGLRISTRSMEETQFFMKLMQWLEQTKKENHDNEAITNDVVAQAHLENWALKLFLYADENDRAGVFNKNVIQAFYTSSMIYQLIKTFGPLNEEAERNMKYAKWKSVYINNCLKKGETPVSGPLETDEKDEENDTNVDINAEIEEISENINDEYLDAVAMNYSVENNEEEKNLDLDAETDDENNEKEKNIHFETKIKEEHDEEIQQTENLEVNIDEENNEKENKEITVTETQEESAEEEIEGNNPDNKDNDGVQDTEENENSVTTSEEENNEEADTSKNSDIFPSVPNTSTDHQRTKDSSEDVHTPVTPHQYNPAPTPTNGGSSCSFDKNNITVKTEGGIELTPEQMVRAQKLIKWAGSALNYDDVPTAVTNLQQALNLLTIGQE